MLFSVMYAFRPGRTIPVAGLALLLFSLTACEQQLNKADHSTWTHYGGSPDQSRFFEAPDITKANVGQMELAWMYPSGDDLSYFFSPIIVDTTMYVLGKHSSLIALSVVTGEELWIHAHLQGITRRGINYWESADKQDKRLIFTLNNTIQAIDAETGQSILSFGENGHVDLRQGLGRDPTSIRRIQPMMPGVIYEDLLIIGSAPGESYFSPPGYVRAYNVVSGELAWTFHTIPLPGEFGHDTWPEDAHRYAGGVNVWSEISVDPERGIAYLPIGSPTYDYYGADRRGSNLFANCLVALDARTGERLWHFQAVHHDLWDYDLSPAPQLLTLDRNGKSIDAVAVATKNGLVFVFDRVTGEPVFPIEEKPVPASTMPGEKAWPTQPMPSLPPFTRHEVTRENLNPYFSDRVTQQWHQRLDTSRSAWYVPPSDQYESIVMPGALGGANYGNTAADPDQGIMYIMTQEYASIYRLHKVEPPKIDLTKNEIERMQAVYTSTCQTCHGKDMAGGLAPSLLHVGRLVNYDEFKGIINQGRGQMPGFPHVDEQTIQAMYRFLGGNPRRFNRPTREREVATPDGPVVASGGATVPPDASRGAPMLDYPDGVEHPEDRYTTEYGLDWPALLSPPWSSLLAYDLNKGTIRWRAPIGQDSLYAQGDKTKGAPSGALRKGMVVTSTGLVFATAKGGLLYAFDADTGEVLWETTLSHEAQAQPSMYSLNGKSYLVINATSNFSSDSYDHAKKPGALPKGYLVFALPEEAAFE